MKPSLGFVKLNLAMKEGEEEFKREFDDSSTETVNSYLVNCIREHDYHTLAYYIC
ncbi:16946_t:CDS:2 [Cetraspora pellucida]|uniref:16946_t:CDS:1 n=1 Tax=Cetraspora pellucida TaxID=1433469 RepID=A0A9N8W9X5_9GLOM|nr:16946_t:CDS:2 [Cetraspora pellucida]